MVNKNISSLHLVTVSDNDTALIDEVAAIEKQIQPLDSWNKKTITDLLEQDINMCWVVQIDSLTQNLNLTINAADITSEYLELKNNNQENCIVVAYCIFSAIFEVAEILRIGTNPNFQRLGYAEWLLNMLIKNMPNKGLEKILLEVRSDNNGAINLYKKMGFKIIHVRKGYYSKADKTVGSKSCDALIMEFELT